MSIGAALPQWLHLRGGSGGRLGRLLRERRGAAAIEFALVAAPFFALLLASIETSLVFFAQQTHESAAEMTGRELLTGKAQSDGLTQQQFKTLACSKLPIFMKCANLSVDVTVAPSFAAANTSRPVLTYDVNGNPTNGWQFQSGNPGDILVLKLVYLWPLPTGPLGFNLSDASGSRRLMLATSVFKTEPYVS